jgi:hypothetical protein
MIDDHQILKVPYNEAVSRLSAIVNEGFELRLKVVEGSIRETPTSVDDLRRQFSEIRNYIERSHQVLEEIISDKTLINYYRKIEIQKKIIEIAPEDQDHTGIFSPRREAATRLADIMQNITDYLLTIYIYIEMYGEDQRLLSLRLNTKAVIGKLENLLKNNNISFAESLEKYYESIFNKIQYEGKSMFIALKERITELEQNPIRPEIKIDGIYMNKVKYHMLLDDIGTIKSEFEASVFEKINAGLSTIINGWKSEPPEYNHEKPILSYDKMEDYIAQLLVDLKKLPNSANKYLNLKPKTLNLYKTNKFLIIPLNQSNGVFNLLSEINVNISNLSEGILNIEKNAEILVENMKPLSDNLQEIKSATKKITETKKDILNRRPKSAKSPKMQKKKTPRKKSKAIADRNVKIRIDYGMNIQKYNHKTTIQKLSKKYELAERTIENISAGQDLK